MVSPRFVLAFGAIYLKSCGILVDYFTVESNDRGDYIIPFLVDMFITLGG